MKTIYTDTIYPKKNTESEEGFIAFCSQIGLSDEERKDKRVLNELKSIYL